MMETWLRLIDLPQTSASASILRTCPTPVVPCPSPVSFNLSNKMHVCLCGRGGCIFAPHFLSSSFRGSMMPFWSLKHCRKTMI